MKIHREGYRLLTVIGLFLMMLNLSVWRLASNAWGLWLLVPASVVVFILVLQFFRYPDRTPPNLTDLHVLSPADGKVVVIEDTLETEYFDDERLMISIFMSPLNVHSNHHPVSGKVVYQKYHPGKYLVAWHPKSSTLNERTTVVYETATTRILVRQIAGAVARRIVNYCKEGQAVERGGEMGFIKFGSRVDIYLPTGTEYAVKIGQKVRAKLDVIAKIKP